MFDADQFLTFAALLKWSQAEELSVVDAERIITVIATKDLKIAGVDQQTLVGLQVKLRSVLTARFFQQGSEVKK